MRTNLSLLTMVIVSLLGLTSCSPDAGEDGWKLREPHVSEPDRPDRPLSMAAALLERPSARAELVFEDGDLADSTLEVTSICTGKGEKVTERQVFTGLHRLPLGSLWPQPMWKKLKEAELEDSVCTFEFVARNSRGSTHSFDFSGLRLRSFATFDAANAVRATGESWSLICDGFTTESSEESGASSSVHVLASRAPSENRPLGHQNCRVLSKKVDARNGLKTFALSKSFDLDFPNPPARIESKFSTATMGTPRADEPLLVLSMVNSSSVPIAYRFALPAALRVLPLMTLTQWESIPSTPNSLVAIARFDEPLTVSVQGAAARWSQDGLETIVLPPRSTVTVTLSFARARRCLRGEPERSAPWTPQPSESERAELAGFYFAFTSGARLESIDYWSEADPRARSESYTASTLDLPIARTQMLLDGFQGVPKYSSLVDSSGAAPNPSLVKLNEGLLTRWCHSR